jgi:predicted regulator of Ras-like GTPase activity (Roadblock/LC7/MglB family)
MATTGSLREIPLAALIETGCRSRAAARLRLRHGDLEGELYFSDGELVHAVCGELKGEPALWKLLRWTDGQFTLEEEVRSPERTLYRPWQDLLLEGMQRVVAPEPAGSRSLPPGEMVSRLKAIEGVMGVVVAGPDGVVLAADVPEGKGEAEGALTVYLAAAAETLAGFLPMGAFEHAVVAEPQRRLLIFRHPPFIVGLVLSPQASPALVLAELPGRLS